MRRIRPFLKWPGNKYRCLDNILAVLPKGNRLIEPFAGSAAVSMNTNYPEYLLAEDNYDLINLFHCLKQEGNEFINYCKQFFTGVNNCAAQYYLKREEFNHCQEPKQRAAIFLYLNRHGYNGLCRYNQRGIYNVPFGRHKAPYFPLVEMQHFYKKSQQTTFIHNDFRETFKKALPGDVIYCDPPYAPLSQGTNFSAYTGNKFGEQEQIALAKLAIDYANQGITVIISNHDTIFVRHHYRHSEIRSFPVRRSISCHANNRRNVTELVAIFK